MPHSTIGLTPTEHNKLRYHDQQHIVPPNTNQDPNVINSNTLPMTQHYEQSIDARALNSRLSSLQNQSQDQINNEHGGLGVPRSSSLDSDVMPRFTKSATMSTTGTNDSQYSQYSGLRVMRAEPSSNTHWESVGVAQGEFSKPRVPARSRRDSNRSSGSGEQKEFKYYGRHSNQWLFNDFSVTDAVSKGFKRVFRKDNSNKDWYEDREK